MALDLVVPDLLLPGDAPARLRSARLPFAEKWLARADASTQAKSTPLEWLAHAYGLEDPAPFAAIALAGEGASQDAQGEWLRADPVHLRIDHDAVMLHDASVLGLARNEAAELVAALQAHFAVDGMHFAAPDPNRWYVRVRDGESARTTPLAAAFGRNVFGLLPEPRGRFNWRAALTEAQMTLASHAVNRRREEEGKLAANSIWPWGEGRRPASIMRRYGLVHADEVFARGLGMLSGAQVRALPKGLAGVDLAAEGVDVLAWVDSLGTALRRGDEAAWLAQAGSVDELWFAPLADALERFGTVRLILPSERGTRVATLTPASRWRLFRARKPLAFHA